MAEEEIAALKAMLQAEKETNSEFRTKITRMEKAAEDFASEYRGGVCGDLLDRMVSAVQKSAHPTTAKREVYATRRRPELDQPNSEAWELEDGEIIQQLTNAEIERRNALLMYRPGEGETKTFRKKSIPAKPQKD